MKIFDLILIASCLIMLFFGLYCLTQLDNVRDECIYKMQQVINNSPCAGTLEKDVYIIPFKGGEYGDQDTS